MTEPMKRSAALAALLLLSALSAAVNCAADERTDYILANELYEAGDFESAKDEFERFAQKYRDSGMADDALFLAGESARNLGRYDDAARAYRALQNDYPDSELRLDALLGLASAWKASGKLEESILAFEQVANQTDDEKVKALAVYLIGDAQFDIGNYERALEAYERVIRQFPLANEAAPAAYGKGWSLFHLKRYREARDVLFEFAQTYPKAPEAPEALYRAAEAVYLNAESDNDAKQNQEAKSLYEQFLLRYGEEKENQRLAADAALRIGLCLFRLNKPTEARRQLEKVVQRYPQMESAEEAQFWIGTVLYHEGGSDPEQYKSAIYEFQRLLAAYPDSDFADGAQYHIGRCRLALRQYQEAADSFKPIADDPESALQNAAAFYLGECKRHLEEYSAALVWYRRVVEADSEYEDDALFGTGHCHFALGEYRDAVESYDRVSKMADSPLRKTALFELGRSLYRAGRHEDADRTFDAFLNDPAKNDPTAPNDHALYWQTLARNELRRYPEAAESAQRLLSGYPKSSFADDARFYWGEALYWQKRYAEAREQYARLLQTAPDSEYAARAGYNIGWTRFSEAEEETDAEKKRAGYQEAVNVWKPIADDPQSALAPRAAYYVGLALLNMKRHDEAIQTFLNAAKTYPNSDWADDSQYQAAWARYSREEYENALNAFDSFLKKPEFQGSSLAPEAVFFRGSSYFKLRRYREAIADFLMVAEQYPNAVFSSPTDADTEHIREEALYKIGESRYNLGEYSEAIDAYLQLQRLYPKSALAPNAQYSIAGARQLMGETQLSIDAFRELAAKYPNSRLAPESLYSIGVLRFDSGQYQEAIAEFQKVIERYANSPAAPRAQYDIGHCYFQLESFPQAVAAYDRAAAQEEAPPEVRASALYYAAQTLQAPENKQPDLNEALQRLESLIGTYPNAAEAPLAYLLKAGIYNQMQLDEEALQAFRTLIAEHPQTEEARAGQIDLGNKLLGLNRHQEAADAVASIVENQSDFRPDLVVSAQMIDGRARAGMNEYEEAARSYLIVALVYPDHSHIETLKALVQAGDAYERLNKIDQAVRWYRKAVEQYQSHPSRASDWDPYIKFAQEKMNALAQPSRDE